MTPSSNPGAAFYPKKRFGQNFLIDKNIQNKIIDACCIKKADIVLEVGAGGGELTEAICPQAAKVYAIELDRALADVLKQKFSGKKNVTVINQDILKLSLNKYFPRFIRRLKVIGNIPYYISSPIIEYLFGYRKKIDSIYLTVQKEFGERILASPGTKDYGSFSLFVQYYAEAQKLFLIKKGCFRPSPKVDSCFLRLKIREKPPVKIKDEKLLFKIIRSAFGKRRKTLRNSLREIISQETLNKFFALSGKNINIRPEELTLGDFARLTRLSEANLYAIAGTEHCSALDLHASRDSTLCCPYKS